MRFVEDREPHIVHLKGGDRSPLPLLSSPVTSLMAPLTSSASPLARSWAGPGALVLVNGVGVARWEITADAPSHFLFFGATLIRADVDVAGGVLMLRSGSELRFARLEQMESRQLG